MNEREPDFTNAERGRFHRPGMKLRLPYELDQDVLSFLIAKAEEQERRVEEVLQEIVRREMQSEGFYPRAVEVGGQAAEVREPSETSEEDP